MRIAATRPASSRDRLTKVELGESHELENPCSISFAVERDRWSIDECTDFPVTLFRREFKLCENTLTRTLRYEVLREKCRSKRNKSDGTYTWKYIRAVSIIKNLRNERRQSVRVCKSLLSFV